MKISNAFKPVASTKRTQKGSAGYDNPRENIDPHIKTQAISSKELTLSTDRDTTAPVGEVLKLQYLDQQNPDAKVIVAFMNEAEQVKAWLACHDWLTYPTVRHSHFSIEISDAAGLRQTRLGFPWDEDNCEIYTNQADFKLNRNTGEVNGNLIFSGGGGGGAIKHDNEMKIFPNGTTTLGLQVSNNGSNIQLQCLGSNTIDINDGVDVIGNCDANTYSVAGAAGASGNFTTVDGKTVTVVNGIITSIV